MNFKGEFLFFAFPNDSVAVDPKSIDRFEEKGKHTHSSMYNIKVLCIVFVYK